MDFYINYSSGFLWKLSDGITVRDSRAECNYELKHIRCYSTQLNFHRFLRIQGWISSLINNLSVQSNNEEEIQ